ncbi:hypothetical protein AB3X52_11565 [Nocardioides sp. DS6]|uniref:Alpha/beta hydrolase n=1 Tax=Nocardioides eburneus TaxID=3231482 RepID=A0ABV3SZ86_9ACTN
MSASPETVPAVVLSVEDRPVVEPPAPPSRITGVVRIARVAWGLTRIARRPLAAPLALAAGPLARIVAHDGGPVAVLRAGGRDVGVEEVASAALGDRLLVLVPPPGSDERVWEEGSETTGATYADRLAALLGWEAVHVRVAAGAGEVESAVALSALLQRVVDAWPVPPVRLTLLAYGAGGLLARHALGITTTGPLVWQSLATELVALGTPSYAVTSGPVSGGLGRRIDEQLAGIAVVDEALVALPPRDDVDYVLVSDSSLQRPNRVGRVIGDLLWWRHKGWGRARKVRDLFPTGERLTVSTGTAPLANHPEIHSALLRWLA